MTTLTRRQFLKLSALVSGALAAQPLLVACSNGTDQTVSLSVPTATPYLEESSGASLETGGPDAGAVEAEATDLQTAPDSAAQPAPLSEPAQPASETPHLVVARNLPPEDLVRRALDALGGMAVFVPKGAWVIIKPNICVAYHSYEYAATTNPWVVGALVKLAYEAGAGKVQVMDNPFGGTADEAYTRSGIGEQVEAAGGEMVAMAPFKYVSADIPDGLDIKKWDIYDDILKADVVIDVPVAKHHSLARLTLGMKNLMGTVSDRGGLHRNLGQRIADLTSRVRPALTVIDAVRILTANGPTGGSLDDVRQLDTLIASPDIVAADSYAATLFGMQPVDLAYVVKASEMNLGRSDLQNLRIEEISA